MYTLCTPYPRRSGRWSEESLVLIGELAGRIGRHVDTLKRWEEAGLLTPRRDERGRRIYGEEDFMRCLQLAALSVSAQKNSVKLAELAERLPVQLELLDRWAS